MNQPVRDLLHERADRLEAPLVDVSSIIDDGSRLRRRRRARTVGGVGVLAACAVLGAAALPGLLPPTETAATEFSFASAFAQLDPAYAVGSTVHLAGEEFSVPTPVLAMVQTTEGIVYSDRQGQVWSAPGDEPAVQVGSTDRKHPRLVAEGSRAAWAEPAAGGVEFVVLDQQSGSTARPLTTDSRVDDPEVLALDGDDLYLRDDRGLVRVGLADDSAEVLSPWLGDLEVTDVEEGLIAHTVPPGPRAGSLNGFVGPSVGGGTRLDSAWTMLDLSDDGRFLLGETEPDTFAVFDVAAGTAEPITSPNHGFLVGYRWLDQDTYLALGMNRPWNTTPVDLLRCDIGTGCEITAEAIGTVKDGLTLPFGESMDG